MQRPLPLTPLSPFGMDGRRQPRPPGCPGGPSLHRPVCTRLIVFRQADDGAGRGGGGRRVGGHARARDALEEPLDLI